MALLGSGGILLDEVENYCSLQGKVEIKQFIRGNNKSRKYKTTKPDNVKQQIEIIQNKIQSNKLE